ncbi:hypothetical protein B0T17DRAFT_597610 [Bombardia bombarda]|uniref:Uncharacterized protein n=1 Tax=Bombardia bombarda TaxID=252184 RepID=A0AA39X8A3_9PEZI|nr:hypothetical protein B0T17DRAFT_597610 [Bombardia bombarda]
MSPSPTVKPHEALHCQWAVPSRTLPLSHTGNFTIRLSSGLAVRIPNSQLVLPYRYVDRQTGAVVANATNPIVNINSNQQVNLNDIPKLGRQFLSAAYLTVNEEANEFSLYTANPTSREDLVAFGADGKETTEFCNSNDTSTSSGDANRGNAGGGGLSTGALAGIVVGGVAAAVALAAAVWFWLRKKKNVAKVGGGGGGGGGGRGGKEDREATVTMWRNQGTINQ